MRRSWRRWVPDAWARSFEMRRKPMVETKTGADDTIVEVKETLTGERREFRCTVVARATRAVVVSYRSPIGGVVEDVSLPAGTLTLGYFWETRPYNVYHWIAPDGRTLGLYFNVSDTTRITPGRVAWRDLAVDVLITADGRCRVLDEDELPSDLDRTLKRQIEEIGRAHV